MSKNGLVKGLSSKFFPIIFTIIHLGGLGLSGIIFMLGIMAGGSGSGESQAMAVLILITPFTFLFGPFLIWGAWKAEKPFLMLIGFLLPAFWWGVIYIFGWALDVL